MLDSEGFVAAVWVHNLRLHCFQTRFSEEILSWSQGNLIISYHFITGQSFSNDKCYTITTVDGS